MSIETVTIKTAPCEGNEKGEVVINKCDFDPAVHTLAGESAQTELDAELKRQADEAAAKQSLEDAANQAAADAANQAAADEAAANEAKATSDKKKGRGDGK